MKVNTAPRRSIAECTCSWVRTARWRRPRGSHRRPWGSGWSGSPAVQDRPGCSRPLPPPVAGTTRRLEMTRRVDGTAVGGCADRGDRASHPATAAPATGLSRYTQKNSCVPESSCGPTSRTGLTLAPVSAPVVTVSATVKPPSAHGVTRGRLRRCAAARTMTRWQTARACGAGPAAPVRPVGDNGAAARPEVLARSTLMISSAQR